MKNENLLEEIAKKYRNEGKISIEYEVYGVNTLIITCIFKYKNLLPIYSISNNVEDAISNTMKLFDKIYSLNKKYNIKSPSLENQKFNNGYYREYLTGDLEIEYKRINNQFVITGVNKKDKNDWYYFDPPIPLTENLKFLKTTEDGDLYIWNTLGLLSGSVGKVIVKNGMMVKQKMIAIS